MDATLLSAVTATGNGEWIEARGLSRFSVDVSGITTATVQLRGSNAAVKPADNTHERQLGTDFAANGMQHFTSPVKWIKAMVSAYTSGTITVNLHGTYGG
jgi:hypothetical protein